MGIGGVDTSTSLVSLPIRAIRSLNAIRRGPVSFTPPSHIPELPAACYPSVRSIAPVRTTCVPDPGSQPDDIMALLQPFSAGEIMCCVCADAWTGHLCETRMRMVCMWGRGKCSIEANHRNGGWFGSTWRCTEGGKGKWSGVTC
jgi:hypothetical protein